MNNENIIKLVPLLEGQNGAKALHAIESGNFDINEVSEKGNDLFKVAFYYGEFDVAKKLLSFNTENNQIFSLNIGSDISTPLFDGMLYRSQNMSKDMLHEMDAYKNFIEINNVILKLDFTEVINVLNSYDASIFNRVDYIQRLKYFLDDADIKQLEPVTTIKQLSKLKCSNLLQLYYDICEFEQLPIQEHPSFKLLKDVATNPTKYYDFYVVSKNEKVEDLNHNINPLTTSTIKEHFEQIERTKDFAKYFKKGRDFLPDIFKLHKMPYFDRRMTSPQIEVDNIHQAIRKLNDGVLVENPDKFLKHYLSNWPIHD